MALEDLIGKYGLQQLMQMTIYFVEHQFAGKIYSDCYDDRQQALQEAQKQWNRLPDQQKPLHRIAVWSAAITGNQVKVQDDDMFEIDFLEQLWQSN